MGARSASTLLLAVVVALGSAACTLSFDDVGDGSTRADALRTDGAPPIDGARGDSTTLDVVTPPDPSDDATAVEDAPGDDAGGSSDAEPFDAGPPADLGPGDAGEPSDLGAPDTGSADVGPSDAGTLDTGPPDAGGGPCATGDCLDVVVLIDLSGSHWMTTGNFIELELVHSFVDDVLALRGTPRVGIAGFSDYPVSPYGLPTDVPFEGLLAPTDSRAMIDTTVRDLAMMFGGDDGEALVEGLHVLTGGTPHPTSRPFSCATGTEPGGCWRPGARRAIVVLTDEAHHNLPGPGDGVLDPYGATVSPAAPSWTTVRDAITTSRTGLFAVVPSASDAEEQMTTMLGHVGQVPAARMTTYATPRDLRAALLELVPLVAAFAAAP